MERGLSWLMAPYTAAEQAVIQGKLWQLLERADPALHHGRRAPRCG